MTRRVFFTIDKNERVIAERVVDATDSHEAGPGAELVTNQAKAYRESWGANQVLDVFSGQNGFRYMFDSTPDGRTNLESPANRVVAAWGRSKPNEPVGDRRLLRRFPLPASGRALDRGHLIAMASGGGENVNLVPQASGLNRGHTSQGKRWRALERHCALNPGIFMFIGVGYDDVSDMPALFDYHLIDRAGSTRHERFANCD